MGPRYRSFWFGTIAAIVIAFIAGGVLNSVDSSSSKAYSTSNVRPGGQ